MAPTTTVHHPIFARVYERFAPMLEAQGAAEHRKELLAGISGRVIEVGAGSGLNFTHYPEAVSEVVAVEPESRLRATATAAAQHAPVMVHVIDGTADRLPVENETFDAAVASLVLCSVPDQAVALRELFRVIRPGGELRFYEHVLSNDPKWAKRQRRIAPVWRCFAGGCNPHRDTARAIEAAGFKIEAEHDFLFIPNWSARYVAPHVIGRARRP
jgi:ubiquinone/menaquinone biosynthesis C-methylase UbiE